MGEAREVAEEYYKKFEAGDLDAAAAMFADGCTHVTPAGSQSNDQHKMFGAAYRAGVPDAKMRIDSAIESGDEVAIEGHFRGTHSADVVSPDGTIPASGNAIDLRFSDFFKVAGGRIVEHRIYWDQMDMMQQLGAMPPPG